MHGVFRQFPHGDVVSIELERTPCFGACPVYHVTLKSDGTLTYVGTRFVDHLGTWKADISTDDFGRIVALLKPLNFYTMNDKYTVGATDMATKIVTIKSKKRTKSVSEYGPSGPAGLWAIQTVIDSIVDHAFDWKEVKSALQKGK